MTTLRPAEVAQRGIARTFQNIRLFGDMSVIDNVSRWPASVTSRAVLGRAAVDARLPAT